MPFGNEDIDNDGDRFHAFTRNYVDCRVSRMYDKFHGVGLSACCSGIGSIVGMTSQVSCLMKSKMAAQPLFAGSTCTNNDTPP